MPERRPGPYKESGKRIPWDDIFVNHAGDHFVFDKEEYTSAASVRSSGIGYRNRNNLKGALHVLNMEEDPEKLVVWFTPGEEEDNGTQEVTTREGTATA